MSRRKRKLRRKAAELIALKVLKKRRRRRRRAGIGGKAARLLAVLAAVAYLKTGIFRGRGEEDSQIAANTKRRGLFVRKSAAAAVKAPKRKRGILRRIFGGAMRFAGRKLTQKKTPKKGLLFFKR